MMHNDMEERWGYTWPLSREQFPRVFSKFYRYRSVRKYPFAIRKLETSTRKQVYRFEGEGWVYDVVITGPQFSVFPEVEELSFSGDYDRMVADIISCEWRGQPS